MVFGDEVRAISQGTRPHVLLSHRFITGEKGEPTKGVEVTFYLNSHNTAELVTLKYSI